MRYFFQFALLLCCFTTFAQIEDGSVPNAIYEIRYWQNLSEPGNTDVVLDTMIYYGGNDRAGFAYANAECVSFHCRETDDMIYTLLPKFNTETSEWMLKDKFVRRIQSTKVPFRAVERNIHWVYVCDKGSELSGFGDYSMVSKEFGVISRYNYEGDFYQLIRIDVYKNRELLQEIDMLPLHDKLYEYGAYTLRPKK